VNQYDTEAMLELFKKAGYEVVDFDQIADVYIVNTCTVTNLGDRKSRQAIRRAHRLNPDAVIGVAGCYAQRAPQELLAIPGVRLVLGTKNRSKIVELVEKVHHENIQLDAVENIMITREFEDLAIEAQEGHTRAFLKIQEGCNQFCSYCIIPYARGPIRSRKRKDIVDEVKRLAEAGFKEIVLTGIHIASYGKDTHEGTLLDVIQDIHPIPGIERIRLGSIEPTLLQPSFAQAVADMEKMCRHYHVSLQSGSDSVLMRMNRKYTAQEYKEYINNLRDRIPTVSITTDIMVGFPGETEAEFEESIDFVRDIRFSKIHVFQYSVREGTPAAQFGNQVPGPVKDDRSKRLIQLGDMLEKEYISQFLGTVQEVLIEEPVPGQDGWVQGFTDHYIKVMVQAGEELKNSIVQVYFNDLEDDVVVGKVFSND